jgi:RNA-directed DNA polymerase
VRRKLRCVRLKPCKLFQTIADFLHRLGVPTWRAWITALSGQGWWRLSRAPSVSEALTAAWFDRLGLMNLERQYVALQH